MNKKFGPATIQSRYDYFSDTMSPPNVANYYDDQTSLFGDPVLPPSVDYTDGVHRHLFGVRHIPTGSSFRKEASSVHMERTSQNSDADSGVHILSGTMATPDNQRFGVTRLDYNKNQNLDEPKKVPSSYSSKVRRRRADLNRSGVDLAGTKRVTSKIPISRTRSFPNRDEALKRTIPSGPSLELDDDSSNSNNMDECREVRSIGPPRIPSPVIQDAFIRTGTAKHRPSIDSEVSTTYVDKNVPLRQNLAPPPSVQKRISFQTNQSFSDDQESVIGGHSINYSNFLRQYTQSAGTRKPKNLERQDPLQGTGSSPDLNFNRSFPNSLYTQRQDSMSNESDMHNEFSRDIYPADRDSIVRMIPSRPSPELDIDKIVPDRPCPLNVRMKPIRPPLVKDDSLVVMIPSGPSIEKEEKEPVKDDTLVVMIPSGPSIEKEEPPSLSDSNQPPSLERVKRQPPSRQASTKSTSNAPKIQKPKMATKKVQPPDKKQAVPPINGRMPGSVAYRIIGDEYKLDPNSSSGRTNSETDTSKTSVKTVISKKEEVVSEKEDQTKGTSKKEPPKPHSIKGILKEPSPESDITKTSTNSLPSVPHHEPDLDRYDYPSPVIDYAGNSDSTAKPGVFQELASGVEEMVKDANVTRYKITDSTGKIRMDVIHLNEPYPSRPNEEDVSNSDKKRSSQSSDDIQMRFGSLSSYPAISPTGRVTGDSFSGSDWYRPSNDFQEFGRIPRMRPASKNILAINQESMGDTSPLVALIQDSNGSSSGEDKEMRKRRDSLLSEENEENRSLRPKTASTGRSSVVPPVIAMPPKRDVSPVIMKNAITTGSTYRADPPRAHKKSAFTVIADDFNSGLGAKRVLPQKHRPQSSPNRPVMSASRLRLPAIGPSSTSDVSPRPSVQFDLSGSSRRSSSAQSRHDNKTATSIKFDTSSKIALPKVVVNDQNTSKQPKSTVASKAGKAQVPNPTSREPGLMRVISLPDLSPSRIMLMKLQEIEDVVNKKSKYGSASKLDKRKTFNLTRPSTLKKKSSSTTEISNEQLLDHITSSFLSTEPEIPQKSPSRFFGDLSRPKTIFQYTDDRYMQHEDRKRFLVVDDPGYMPRSPRRIIKRSTLSPIIGTPNKDEPETPEDVFSNPPRFSVPDKKVPPSPRFNVRRRSSISDMSSLPSQLSTKSRAEGKSRSRKESQSESPPRRGKPSRSNSRERRGTTSKSGSPKKLGRASRSNSISSSPKRMGRSSLDRMPKVSSPKKTKNSGKTSTSDRTSNRGVSKVTSKSKVAGKSDKPGKSTTASSKDLKKVATKAMKSSTSAKKSSSPIKKLVSSLKKSSTASKKENTLKKSATKISKMANSMKKTPSSTKLKTQENDTKTPPPLKRQMSALKRSTSNLQKETDKNSPVPVKREPSNISIRSMKSVASASSVMKLKREDSNLKKPKTDVMAKLKRQTANIIRMRNAGSTFGSRLSKKASRADLRSEGEDSDGEKLVPMTKANVVSMTTAAITAQPVEVTTKIHNAVSKTKSQHSLISNQTDSGASLEELPAAILEKSTKTLETVQKTVAEATEEIQKTISENLTNLKSLETGMMESIDIGGTPTIFETSESVETVIENKADIASPEKPEGKPVSSTQSKPSSPDPPTQPIEAKVSIVKRQSSRQLLPPNAGSATSSTTSSTNGPNSAKTHHEQVNNVGSGETEERVSVRAFSALPEVECESANFQKKPDEKTIVGEVMEAGQSGSNNDAKKSAMESAAPKAKNGNGNGSDGIQSHHGSEKSGGGDDKKVEKKSSGSQEYLEGEQEPGCCGNSRCGRACSKLCMPCKSLRRLSCCQCSKCCVPCCSCCRKKNAHEAEKTTVKEVNEKKESCWKRMKCCRRDKTAPKAEKIKAQRMESIKEEVTPAKQHEEAKPNKCRDCCRGFFCCGCMRKKGRKKEVEKKIAPLLLAKTKEDSDKRKCCFCIPCGRKKPEAKAWPEKRRESILSEPKPKVGCCTRMADILCCRKKKSIESRRPSMTSKKQSIAPTNPPEDTRPKLHIDLVEFTSKMKAAIPVMPLWLAYFCMFFNVVIPGTGTALSGLFCLCVGIPRFSQYDSAKARFGSFLINCIVGASQLFCVVFCCVGWGWSIWWGTIMLKTARKLRKIRKIEKLEQQEEQRQAVLKAQRDAEAAQA